ncbi:MAG: fused MFS/spermidine synthase, partial [Candidatus Hinthialibacter sp.]
SLISVFLGGLTVGYWSGGFLADKKADYRIFSLLLLAPGLLLLFFPLYADVVCDYVWDMDLDPRYSSLLSSLMLFFLPSIFMGAVSPYAVKMRVDSLTWLGKGVGGLYALSSLGSIIGTLVTTFYLITWIGVRKIIVCEGIILLLVSGALFAAHFYHARRSAISAAAPLSQ